MLGFELNRVRYWGPGEARMEDTVGLMMVVVYNYSYTRVDD